MALMPQPIASRGVMTSMKRFAMPSRCQARQPRAVCANSFDPERDRTMNTKLTFALAVLTLLATAPLLGACHTTAGAGEDISATGHTIDKAATNATP
jgi:predicted small secreted protein